MKHQILIVLIAVAACGGSSPTAPTPPPLAQPDLVATGNATFPGDCPDGACSYEFVLTNRGQGCGSNVKGTIALLVNGVVNASDEWALLATTIVRPGEQVEVKDCCLMEGTVAVATTVRIQAQATAVSCP